MPYQFVVEMTKQRNMGQMEQSRAIQTRRISRLKQEGIKEGLMEKRNGYIEDLKSPFEEVRKEAIEYSERRGQDTDILALVEIIKRGSEVRSVKERALNATVSILSRRKNIDRIHEVHGELEEIKKQLDKGLDRDPYLNVAMREAIKQLGMLLHDDKK